MSNDPKGFEENPQAALDVDDDEALDESLRGPQEALTPEEQADYDAWFRRKVQASLDYAKRPDAVFYSHEEVMQRMRDRLERRIAEARSRED